MAGAGALALLSRPAIGLAMGLAIGPTGDRAPEQVERLMALMTVEEKAGQLTLMASAIGGAAASALNPPNGNDVAQQLAAARAGRITGIFSRLSIAAR